MDNDEDLFSWCEAIKNILKTALYKECTYVQKYINGNGEKVESTEDIEPTFFSSYFLKKPVFTVESIEERLNEMNLDWVQKKGEKFISWTWQR